MSFFSANQLSVKYGKDIILQNLSFEIEAGCITGILGANGCGKTTLLKAICNILPHEGTCSLNNITLENLSAKDFSKLCGYIPQKSSITIDISVLDVVLMGFNPQLSLFAHPTEAMKLSAIQVLSLVGLSGKEETNYLHLSEGQKQLCIFARTLVSDHKLLLLDEPESALDFKYRYQMLSLLQNWVVDHERSVMVSLHDPFLALNYCDKILLLSDNSTLTTIYPKADSLPEMEKALTGIYGNISLHTCLNRYGQKQLVMLKEEDA